MKNDIKPSERMWRTLMRVDGHRINGIMFIIPGWDYRTPVFVPWDQIDERFHGKCDKVGFRLHCYCNTGEDDMKKLKFERWED